MVPVSVFFGRRRSTLEGDSDSFGRVVGTAASSPNPTRNIVTQTDLEMGENRYGIQADFGAPGTRFRSYARLAYETMKWELSGPPTGGAGFGGTVGNLQVNSFTSACNSDCGRLLSSTRNFTASPNPPRSRGPMLTLAVTLALLASFFCCLATKSIAPPKHAA